MKRIIAWVSLFVLLGTGCNRTDSFDSYSTNQYQNNHPTERLEQTPEVEDDSFSAYTDSFHGYPCTQDCSGHEAGYRWAEGHNITNEDDCGGNSNSFIEGCRAYVQEIE